MPRDPFEMLLTNKLKEALLEGDEGYLQHQGQYFRVSPPNKEGTKYLLGPNGVAGQLTPEGTPEITGAGFEKKQVRVPKAIGWDIVWQDATGAKKKRTLLRSDSDIPCKSCGGTGETPGTKEETPSWTCESCQGTGEEMGPEGKKACARCKGKGRQYGKPKPGKKCPLCFGAGHMNPKLLRLVNSLRQAGRPPKVSLTRGKQENLDPLEIVPD